MLRQRLFLLAGLLPAISFQHGFAAENWDLCRVPSYQFLPSESVEVGDTAVEALSVVSENESELRASGNVLINRSNERIGADEVVINKETRQLKARGNVVFENLDYRLRSDMVEVDKVAQTGSFAKSEFELGQRHAHGQADHIEKLDASRTRFENIEYSSCDPGDPEWHLRARELEINQASGRGIARHTTLYLKQVPFIYLPWFQFPIDDRRLSGILPPKIGYSDDDGVSLTLPIYWNQAPNYDMTIIPAWSEKRGLQLNTENRYLFDGHMGQVDLSYLDDNDFDDTRWFQQWRHVARLGYKIDAELLLVDVSDEDFFDDFEGVASEYNNTRHLESRLGFTRSGEIWQGDLQWEDYQTLNPSTATESRPYNRLPRLTIDSRPVSLGMGSQGQLLTEWVNFERNDSVDGKRAHVVPTISWESSDSWYFFQPELQYAFSDYQLEGNPGGESVYRDIPTLGVDTGLIFERIAGSENQWLQTLEPRLYFLYTPYEDQDDIPDFDTSLATSTYRNLFRNNRFRGADRIGDASQVTIGIASKTFDNESGNQLAQIQVGQIVYFKDRRVSLNGVREDESRSDIISEIDLRPNANWKISSRLVVEEGDDELSENDFSATYSKDHFVTNVGYYYTEDELEQALFSLVYPINERWTLIGKYHRSLLFDEPVENLIGLNYESCCWGLKILAGQTGDESDDFAETEKSIYFEFTLKGLSQAGQDIDAQLRESIPGYRAAF